MEAVLASGAVSIPTHRAIAFRRSSLPRPSTAFSAVRGGAATSNGSASTSSEAFTVGEFMIRKDKLRVVKPTTAIESALQMLVEDGISGFPVIDDNERLVGVVSDYDLLAVDSVSGKRVSNVNFFPDVNSSWETFFELQNLLSKNHGKVVSDVMTPSPLSLRESSNLDDAARLLLETRHHRLPVVDASGNLVGVITRGNIMKAAVERKRDDHISN